MEQKGTSGNAAKKTWQKPRLTTYGDPLDLTESAGMKMAEDGGGTQYTKLKTA